MPAAPESPAAAAAGRPTLLAVAPDAAAAQALALRLRAAGWRVAAGCACFDLVREVVRTAPQLVIASPEVLRQPHLAALQALAQARDDAPPVVVWGPLGRAGTVPSAPASAPAAIPTSAPASLSAAVADAPGPVGDHRLAGPGGAAGHAAQAAGPDVPAAAAGEGAFAGIPAGVGGRISGAAGGAVSGGMEAGSGAGSQAAGEAGDEPPGAPELLAAGVRAVLAGDDPAALALNLPLALAWHARHQAQASALAQTSSRLDERKWVDRAKGLLMRHQQLGEDAAFALLRTASMHANLRVGEVSRGVIEAAEAADAVNRAGQLRMLSQRWVVARALAACAAPGRRGDETRAQAEALAADTASRVAANLGHLAGLALPADSPAHRARSAAEAAWAPLRDAGSAPLATAAGGPPPAPADGSAAAAAPANQAVGPAGAAGLAGSGRPAAGGGLAGVTAADLLAADAAAEAALAAADALVEALEQAFARRSLQVVNLAGRQRLRSQRLAKCALLVAAQPQAPGAAGHAAEAVQMLQGLEDGLAALQRTPLVNDELRAAMAAARGRLTTLRQSLQRLAQGPAAAAAVARDSEALLQAFEQLTSLVEHHMQVLLG